MIHCSAAVGASCTGDGRGIVLACPHGSVIVGAWCSSWSGESERHPFSIPDVDCIGVVPGGSKVGQSWF